MTLVLALKLGAILFVAYSVIYFFFISPKKKSVEVDYEEIGRDVGC